MAKLAVVGGSVRYGGVVVEVHGAVAEGVVGGLPQGDVGSCYWFCNDQRPRQASGYRPLPGCSARRPPLERRGRLRKAVFDLPGTGIIGKSSGTLA